MSLLDLEILKEAIFSQHLSFPIFELGECCGIVRVEMCEDAPVEETLASYLSQSATSPLKAPV